MEDQSSRYPALLTISYFHLILAWIVGIVAIISSIFFLKNSDSFFLSAMLFIGGLLTALFLAAISELIKVFIDIEYNTRMALHEKKNSILKDIQSNEEKPIIESSNSIDPNARKVEEYLVPNYEICKVSENSSFGSVTEKHHVKFADDKNCDVFLQTSNKQSYFTQKTEWHTVKQTYKDLDSCINAVHYFLVTGKISKEKYIGPY